ncbi:hypothetical protein SRHO_G00311930 [Serrasalmus rhombeus]
MHEGGTSFRMLHQTGRSPQMNTSKRGLRQRGREASPKAGRSTTGSQQENIEDFNQDHETLAMNRVRNFRTGQGPQFRALDSSKKAEVLIVIL